MDRNVRVLQQSKQKATLTKAVGHVNPKDLTEGIAKTVYIKGSGIYDVIKYNNQIFYSFRYTALKDTLTADTLYLDGDSLYLGTTKFVAPTSGDDAKYIKYDLASSEITYEDTAGVDGDAIHDNVDGEINALSEKGTPVNGDLVLCEDSEDSYSKKKVQMSNLLGGGVGSEGILLATTYNEAATTGILIGAQYYVGA